MVNIWLFLVITLTTQSVFADFESQFKNRYPVIQDVNISKSFSNFYLINGGELGNFFISNDFKFLISSQVIDLEAGDNLQSNFESLQDLNLTINDINLDSAIKLSNGSRKIFIFSDPQYSYWNALDNKVKELKETAVYILPFPIITVHPESVEIASKIWCSSDRAKAWKEYIDSNVNLPIKVCDTPIKEIEELARKYKINATPAIVYQDWQIFPGTTSAKFLNNRVEEIDAKEMTENVRRSNN